jgi:hypothetical protein
MLMYFMGIWMILQTFGIFYDHLVHYSGFRTIHIPRKIWQPWLQEELGIADTWSELVRLKRLPSDSPGDATRRALSAILSAVC